MIYSQRHFILVLLAALAAIFFISFDLFIPNATVAAVPSLQAVLGNVITSGTTAASATVAAPIVVGGLADGAPYYYWSQSQTIQAQNKAQAKYCTANSSDLLCPNSNNISYGYWTFSGYGIDQNSCLVRSDFYSVNVDSEPMFQPVSALNRRDCIATGIFINGQRYGGDTGYAYYPGTEKKVYNPKDPWAQWPSSSKDAAKNLLNDDDLNQILHSGIAGYLTAGQGLPNGAYVSPGDGQPALFQPGLLTVGSSPLYLSSGDFDEDWYSLLRAADQVAAGFGNVVTFGGTNWLREQLYGQIATQDQNGNIYNLGQAIGFGTSVFMPLQVEGEALEAFGRSGEVVEGASSRLVPGAGLSAHEAAGGHLLRTHVGWTEEQLVNRIKTEKLKKGASSFTDRATAEAVVSEAIDADQSRISSWLSGNIPPGASIGRIATLPYTASSVVGIYVADANASAVSASTLSVVLVRNTSSPLGYYILTGFIAP